MLASPSLQWLLKTLLPLWVVIVIKHELRFDVLLMSLSHCSLEAVRLWRSGTLIDGGPSVVTVSH